MDYSTRAAAAAKKVCSENCIAQYANCVKPRTEMAQQIMRGMPPCPGVQHGECPLAKYCVSCSKEMAKTEVHSSMAVTDSDLFALCANCKHAELVLDGAMAGINRIDFNSACLDCPVQMCLEARQEAEAED